MPKLKITDEELNIEELEEAEYTEGDFETYSGELPPAGTILTGFVKKVWWTYTRNDDPLLKILWVADENEGKLAEYNGLPVWENAALIASVKFRWKPFIDTFGITLKDVKAKTQVEDEDESNGAPIIKIASWAPGTDAANCRIVTAREKYNGEWQCRIGKWLPYDADDTDEEEDEDRADDDDEEEAPAPPARGRRAAAKATSSTAKANASGSASKPAAGRRGRRTATAGSDEEPPF